VIACAEDLPQHLALPRGCGEDLAELLGSHGATLRVDDRRVEGRAIEASFHGELTLVQQDAVKQLLTHDTGVLVAPPGTGKTVVGTYLTAARGCSTLVLVHRKPLLDQWRTQLAMFLGVEAKAIGQIGGGKRRTTGWVDVAMLQSLARDGEVDEMTSGYAT
jgi:superfamily II DNA or RNA helicase